MSVQSLLCWTVMFESQCDPLCFSILGGGGGRHYLVYSRLVPGCGLILAHCEWQKDGQRNRELTDTTPLL